MDPDWSVQMPRIISRSKEFYEGLVSIMASYDKRIAIYLEARKSSALEILGAVIRAGNTSNTTPSQKPMDSYYKNLIKFFASCWDGISNIKVWAYELNYSMGEGEFGEAEALCYLSRVHKIICDIVNVSVSEVNYEGCLDLSTKYGISTDDLPVSRDAAVNKLLGRLGGIAFALVEGKRAVDLDKVVCDPPSSEIDPTFFVGMLTRLERQVKFIYFIGDHKLFPFINTPYIQQILKSIGKYIAQTNDLVLGSRVRDFELPKVNPCSRTDVDAVFCDAVLWRDWLYNTVLLEAMAVGNRDVINMFADVSILNETFTDMFFSQFNTLPVTGKENMLKWFEYVTNRFVTKFGRSTDIERIEDDDYRLKFNILKSNVKAGAYGKVFVPRLACVDETKHDRPVEAVGKVCFKEIECKDEERRAARLTKLPGYEKHFAKVFPSCYSGVSYNKKLQLVYENVGNGTYYSWLQGIVLLFGEEILLKNGLNETLISFVTKNEGSWPSKGTEETLKEAIKTTVDSDVVYSSDPLKERIVNVLYDVYKRKDYEKSLFKTLFSAFEFMNKNGVVHGDCHSANVMVHKRLEDGVEIRTLKLIDLGMCMVFSSVPSLYEISQQLDNGHSAYATVNSCALTRKVVDDVRAFPANERTLIAARNYLAVCDIYVFFSVSELAKEMFKYIFPKCINAVNDLVSWNNRPGARLTGGPSHADQRMVTESGYGQALFERIISIIKEP